jgi:hypothetical protein
MSALTIPRAIAASFVFVGATIAAACGAADPATMPAAAPSRTTASGDTTTTSHSGVPARSRRFESPSVGGHRLVRRPLAVIARAGGPDAPASSFNVWFRMNRRLPEASRGRGARALLGEGPDGSPVARISRTGWCYQADAYYGELSTSNPRAGDRVRFRVWIDPGRAPIDVRIPFIEDLPREVDARGEGRVEAPYARALGCRPVSASAG